MKLEQFFSGGIESHSCDVKHGRKPFDHCLPYTAELEPARKIDHEVATINSIPSKNCAIAGCSSSPDGLYFSI